MTEEEDRDALVDGCLWLIVGVGAAVAALVALCSGCAPRTVVIPADREVVPIRQTVTDEAAKLKTYVEDDAGATGWYVPDAVLLDILAEPTEPTD